MSGIALINRATAPAALSKLAGSSHAVIDTLGGDGLVVTPAEGDVVEIEPIPVDVISTHRAGDCFVGMLCAQLATEPTLIEACRNANKMAAVFVSCAH